MGREPKAAAVPLVAPDLVTIRFRECPVAGEFVVGRFYRKCEVRAAPVGTGVWGTRHETLLATVVAREGTKKR